MEPEPQFHRVGAGYLLAVLTLLSVLIGFRSNRSFRDSWFYSHKTAQQSVGMLSESQEELQIELKKFVEQRDRNRIIQATVTFVLLGGALFVVLSRKYTAQDKHWAYGTLGTIIGFWLGGVP